MLGDCQLHRPLRTVRACCLSVDVTCEHKMFFLTIIFSASRDPHIHRTMARISTRRRYTSYTENEPTLATVTRYSEIGRIETVADGSKAARALAVLAGRPESIRLTVAVYRKITAPPWQATNGSGTPRSRSSILQIELDEVTDQ